MSDFLDWEKYVVRQKRPASGCIPTGYEIILRAAGVKNVNFDTFQDEFDLDKNLLPGDQPRNNFESVARAIQAKYPGIHFTHRIFAKGEGQKKIEAVETLLSRRQPVLISLALAPFNGKGWHIMPVVDSCLDGLTLIWGVDELGIPRTKHLLK